MIELCTKKDCTGCGACYNVCPKQAISMKYDVEGFLYPEIDYQLCIECKLCQKSCPILSPIEKHTRVDNPLAVMAKSKALRQKSSSGGMFSILSSWILQQGGVVFGAAWTDGHKVIHRKASDEVELSVLRGSKYLQSDTLFTYKEVKACLKEGKYVLYTGTPCQIAGLYGYLGKTDKTRLYTADLVCHGVPSFRSFQLYLKKLAQKKSVTVADFNNFSFRDIEGWDITPSYKIGQRTFVKNEPIADNLYMMLFLSSRLHRRCCYNCHYTTLERIGDITLADFWGIGDERPFAYDTKQGCSLVLVNSEKGQRLFDDIVCDLNYEKREWSEALVQNHQLHMSSLRPNDRDGVYEYMAEHDYDTIYNHYFNSPYIRLRRFAGKILRKLHLR